MPQFAKKTSAIIVIFALLVFPPSSGFYQLFAAQTERGNDSGEIPSGISLNLQNPISFGAAQEINNLSNVAFTIPVDANEIKDIQLAPLNGIKNKSSVLLIPQLKTPSSVSGLSSVSGDFLAHQGENIAVSLTGNKSPNPALTGKKSAKSSALQSYFSSMLPSAPSNQIDRVSRFYDGEIRNGIAEPSVTAKTATKISRFAQSNLKKAGVVSAVLGVGALSAIPAYAQVAHGPAAHLSVHSAHLLIAGVWPMIAKGAYWLSMGLGFIMGVPELQASLQFDLKQKKFDKRTLGLILASSLVGLIVAPAQTSSDKFLWGAENITVALIMTASLVVSKFLKKSNLNGVKEKMNNREMLSQSRLGRLFDQFRYDSSLQRALVAAVVLTAVGFGIYFGIASFIPAFIVSVSPIKLSVILMMIQTFVQGFYLSLFGPDMLNILRGIRPKSFSPGFVLITCLLDACCVIWGGTQAWHNPLQHLDLVLLAGSNVVQFIFAFFTYRALRRPDSNSDTKGPRLSQLDVPIKKNVLSPTLGYAYC